MHTPGPLVAGMNLPGVTNNNNDPRFIWSGDKIVGMAVSQWLTREEQEANAKLWAAAPRMLEALERVMTYLSNGTPVCPGCLLQAEIQSTLASAKGGTS